MSTHVGSTPRVQSALLADRVEITEYTKRDLEGLLTDEHFWMRPRVPITKHRIISQISNPRADDNDLVLITASHNGQLIAYLGILPDLLVNERRVPVKFGWLTTWWVDKASKHRLAATVMLSAVMRKYSNRIAISSFSDDAKRVYDATKRFQECARFDRLYFILALPPSFRSLSAVMRWIAWAKNRMIFSRTLRKCGLEIRTIESFNEALNSFINKWAVGDPLTRDASYWHWVLKFPWMSASPEDAATQKSYAFSVFAKDFRQIPLLVSRSGTIIALLIMTFRDGRLSLKYAYYEASDTAEVAAALRVAITDINPWLFISSDTSLNKVLKQGLPFYLATWSRSLVAYAARAFPVSVGPRFQFGIGDNIFT